MPGGIALRWGCVARARRTTFETRPDAQDPEGESKGTHTAIYPDRKAGFGGRIMSQAGPGRAHRKGITLLELMDSFPDDDSAER